MLSEDKKYETALKLILFNYAVNGIIKLRKNSVFHHPFDSDLYPNKYMDSVKVHFVFTKNLFQRPIEETITSCTLMEVVKAYNIVFHQEPFLQDKYLLFTEDL